MHHVLVGIDGSQWSEVAARYAHDFASGTEHDIQAVAVLPAKVIETLSKPPQELAYSSIVLDEAEDMGRRAVNDWFQATDEMCEEHDICFVRNIEVGDPVEELSRMSLGAHLTVLGSRGANADDDDKKLGHIARSVMEQTRKPMLVTGPEHSPVKRVVVGFDGSSEAAHAAEMAFAFAENADLEVYMVTGAPTQSVLAEETTYLVELMKAEGLNAEQHIVPGDAPDVILDAMDRLDPDLIAIGGRRKSVGERILYGRAAETICEEASVPVLMYR